MQNKATVIACVNQKGGTGKTCTAENLGIGMVQEGKKVLLVDMDPQASLTISLGYPRPDDLSVTVSDQMAKVMQDMPVPLKEGILTHEEGVDLMPASIALSGLEVSLVNAMSRESILKQYLEPLKKESSVNRLGGFVLPSLISPERIGMVIPFLRGERTFGSLSSFFFSFGLKN